MVIYGANVATAAADLSFGAVQYRVDNVLLGQEDGEATYRRLRARMERGAGLTPEERLDLIFLPLMRHQRVPLEVVADTLVLARQLPERQQRQALASLIGLGHRFLTDAELDTLLEGLMNTNLGQRLIERGLEQGQQKSLLQVLTKRFGPLPSAISAKITRLDDSARLEELLDVALSASSLEEFRRALD